MLLHLEGERERVGGGPSCVASCMLMIFISDLSFVIKGLVLCRERERDLGLMRGIVCLMHWILHVNDF